MKIRTSEPELLWQSKSNLGESPLWVKEEGSIYFVDIKKKIYSQIYIKNEKEKNL